MSEDKLNGQKPDQETIAKIKSKYPNCSIHGYPFPGMYIIYRSFTMADQDEMTKAREIKETELQRQLTETELEVMMVERFVVWPENFKELLVTKEIPAGIPSMLASYIMVLSGFIELRPEVL